MLQYNKATIELSLKLYSHNYNCECIGLLTWDQCMYQHFGPVQYHPCTTATKHSNTTFTDTVVEGKSFDK